MTDEDWRSVVDVHLTGAFLCSRAAQKHMVENRYGRIVNVSSTSALGNRGQSNYSAVKAGLQGFTKTLAIELGRFGVTANAVAPGFVETEMTRTTAERMGFDFEDFVAARVETIPVGRSGKPEDIARRSCSSRARRRLLSTGRSCTRSGGRGRDRDRALALAVGVVFAASIELRREGRGVVDR